MKSAFLLSAIVFSFFLLWYVEFGSFAKTIFSRESEQVQHSAAFSSVLHPSRSNASSKVVVSPAYQLLNRVLHYNGSQYDFALTLVTKNGSNDTILPCKLPCFVIRNEDDFIRRSSHNPKQRIVIEGGPTLSEITAGIGWYLRNVANATSLDIWPPMNITNVDTLGVDWPYPVSGPPIVRARSVPYSYLMNVCTHSYSLVWYTAQDWEVLIDWMALSGINLMLALTGQEWVQYKVFRKLGLRDDEIREWFNGPAFLTWSRGQNEYGGDIAGPLPLSWMQSQWRLQRATILPKLRELDMIGQLPAFQGNVPVALKRLYRDANITEQGGTGWMDSLDPLYGVVADLWMETLIHDFGTDHWYQMDGYFNGGTAPWTGSWTAKQQLMAPRNEIDDGRNEETVMHDDIWYRRGIAAYQGLNRTDPEAVWSFQGFAFVGWDNIEQASYLKGFVDSVPRKENFVIMDMSYDPQQPEWKKWNESAFFGASFVLTVLHNFGGTDGIKGDLHKVNRIPFDALETESAKSGMIGVGATPEGITQNPAYYNFLYEQPFQDEPVALESHMVDKVHRRYGLNPKVDYDADIATSWKLLLDSLYATDRSVQDGTGVAHWTPHRIGDRSSLFELDRRTPKPVLCKVYHAWEHLLRAGENSHNRVNGFHKSQSFQYDLVNLSREVLAQISTPAALNFSDSIARSILDTSEIHSTADFYENLLIDLDTLVGTTKSFLLGRWLEAARRMGRDSIDCELPSQCSTGKECTKTAFRTSQNRTRCEVFYEWNARSQVTTWNPTRANATKVPGGPIDYAAKHWSGLIRDYYSRRIALVSAQAFEDAASQRPLNVSRVDAIVANHAYRWTFANLFNSEHTDYPTTTTGDYIDESKLAFQKYSCWFQSCSSQEKIW